MQIDSPDLKMQDLVAEWRPRPSQGFRIGVAAATLAAVCSAAAWFYVATRPIAVDSFVGAVAGLAGLLLALLAGLLAYGCSSMRYRLTDETVTVELLGIRQIIPLDSVEAVYRGQRLGDRTEVDGINWPGFHVGTARAAGLGRLRFYGTSRDPSDAIILATSRHAYALTPDDLAGFRSRLLERLESLPEPQEAGQGPEPATVLPRPLRLSILRDGVVVTLLVAALLVLLASFGYVSARFPTLPELMPLHYDLAGAPDLIGPPRDAFRMPLIGLVILLTNLAAAARIHECQRDAARILAAATVFVELVMLVAVVRVVH